MVYNISRNGLDFHYYWVDGSGYEVVEVSDDVLVASGLATVDDVVAAIDSFEY